MKWIPMSERLPENGNYYLWCSDMGSVQSDYYWDGFEKEQKYGYNIVAWMPLPRPYTADRKTEPSSSEKPNNCTEPQKICKYCNGKCSWWVDGDCMNDDCRFKPKDEPQTDCNKLINEVVKLDMSREDKFKVMELLARHCEKCKHYLFTDIDGYYCEHETYGQPCGYEPKDEPQTERSE